MRRTVLAFLYLAALVGGCYVAFRPTFDSGFDRTQTGLGDSMFNHFLLEHSWRAISDPAYCGGLTRAPFFHPTDDVYWYSETLLGGAPLYWALRLFMPYDLAYQWWQILCTGLNYVTFALIARWLGCSHLATILGAYFWAFATPHVYQAMHQQLIPRFWMPIAVYHAWQFAAAPNLRSLNRTLGFTFLQCVTCVYTGWFLAVGLVVFAMSATAMKPGGWKLLLGFLRAEWRRAALVTLIWALAFGCFFLPYLLAHQGIRRDYSECAGYLPPLAGWLTGPPGSWWSAVLSPYLPQVHYECFLFVGFALGLLVLTAGIDLWRNREARQASPRLLLAAACLATATVWWVLTLNFSHGVSAWWVVRFLPGGGAIRCLGRVSLMVDLFAVLGAILWLSVVAERIRSPRRRIAVVAVVTAAVIVEQLSFTPPSVAKDEFYPEVKRQAERIRGADAAFLVPRRDSEPVYDHILAMWVALEANVPVVNGYSGRTPHGYPYDFAAHPEVYRDDMLRGWLQGQFRGRVAILELDQDRVRSLQID
jgi:hypothetical protein